MQPPCGFCDLLYHSHEGANWKRLFLGMKALKLLAGAVRA
jgi:hypothetical protein